MINHGHFAEKEMLQLFKGTCEAVRAMHDFRAPKGGATDPFASRQNQSQNGPSTNHRRLSGERAPPGGKPVTHGDDDDDDDDDELFPHPEGGAEGG